MNLFRFGSQYASRHAIGGKDSDFSRYNAFGFFSPNGAPYIVHMAGENGKKSNSAFFLVFQGSVPRQRACMRQVEGFGPK